MVDPVALLDRPVYGMGQAARLLGLRPDGFGDGSTAMSVRASSRPR